MLFHIKDGHGHHRNIDGKIYKSGDLVPSDSDLAKSFPDKFDVVEDDSVDTNNAPTEPVIPTPQEVRGVDGDAPDSPDIDEPIDITVDVPANVMADWEKDEFKDVSDEFELADVAEMKVFRKGKTNFYVVDPSDGEKVHEKPHLQKKAVAEVLSKYVTYEESEEVVEE